MSGRGARRGLRRRIAYAVTFVVVCVFCVWVTQFSVYMDHGDGAQQASLFVFGSWFGHSSRGSYGTVVLAGLIIVALVYLALLALINYFWIATGILLVTTLSFSMVNYVKILARNQPLQPSDFMFVSEGNVDEILTFMPASGTNIVLLATGLIVVVILTVFGLTVRGKPRRWLDWRSRRAWIARGVMLAVSLSGLWGGAGNIDDTNSLPGRFVHALGDRARLWDPTYDYQTNGAITSFMRYIDPTVMKAPEGYSAEAMNDITERYSERAEIINAGRVGSLTDQSVIMILCESCKPPSMTPGLVVSPEATPFLDSLSGTTTGTMLSTGYGGGTANIEYQALTGLSMGLFSPSMTTPFQQLVPISGYTPSAANWWSSAQAVHVYQPNMYSRELVYEKFGMAPFWSLRKPNVVECVSKIRNNPYVSDSCAYQDALDALATNPDETQFISLITMQNHGPYTYSYLDNDFEVSGRVVTDEAGRAQVRTFVQGMAHTDQATREFLEALDALDRPVTVIWYGDHSPSIYASDLDAPSERLATYETQYFIYSNEAARGHGTVLENADYTSSNFFMAQVAEQTSSRVNPFLAMMTDLHEEFAAMGVAVAAVPAEEVTPEEAQRSSGDVLLLDSQGKPIDEDRLDSHQKQLLADYEMIQYDITTGEHYVAESGFMDYAG